MNPKKKAYLALLSVCFFWGTTYFFIRIGVEQIPPFLFAGLRHFLSGIILVGFYVLIKKQALPSKEVLLKLFLIGILLLVFANCFVTWAEVYIPSGLTSLLCSFVPFYMLIFNLILKNNEPINRFSIFGLLLGLLGSFLIFSDNIFLVSESKYTLGIILTIIANISWALGTIYVKKINFSLPPLYMSGLQMLMIGTVILVGSLLSEDYSNLNFTLNGVFALIYLIIIGSIVGFGSYFYAIRYLPTTLLSIIGYVNVIVAMALATMFQNEVFGIKTIISVMITLIGIYFVNRETKKLVKDE